MSFNIARYPFLSHVFIALAVILRVIQRFSSGIQILFFCKLGRKRRFTRLLAWETLFPTITVVPVNWQTFDIIYLCFHLKFQEYKYREKFVNEQRKNSLISLFYSNYFDFLADFFKIAFFGMVLMTLVASNGLTASSV